jgi:hypothetical protein
VWKFSWGIAKVFTHNLQMNFAKLPR